MKTCTARDCTETFEPRGRKAFCSGGCRLQEHRAQRREGKSVLPHRLPPLPDDGARVQTIAIAGPAAFAYADPPYPGKAHLYPECTEVDHVALIAGLVEGYPDGWALSTDSRSLPAFYRWLFDFIGLQPGDSFTEQFPGSGTGGREFEAFSAAPAKRCSGKAGS